MDLSCLHHEVQQHLIWLSHNDTEGINRQLATDVECSIEVVFVLSAGFIFSNVLSCSLTIEA